MTLQERIQKLESGPYWQHLGMKVARAEAGEAVITLSVQHELMQLYGVVHGGALASLVDGAIGAAVQSSLNDGEATTTIDLQVMYSKPAKAGTLTAHSKLVRRGKRIIFGECRVLDEEGSLIVHGNATYMVLEHDRWTKAKESA